MGIPRQQLEGYPAVKEHSAMIPTRLTPPPSISRTNLAMIWEVYARLGLRPEQAVHLLRRQGVPVRPAAARQQIAAARRWNLLRLVTF